MSKKSLRRILLSGLLVLLLPILVLSVSAEITVPKGKDVVLNKAQIEMAAGYTDKLTYTLAPELGKAKKAEWFTADPNVATVSTGSVKAIAPGRTMISLKLYLENGKTVSATCAVEVYRAVTGVKGPATVTIAMGETYEPLPITIAPADATYQGVTFQSAKEDIVRVDNKGVLTPVSPGVTSVVITSQDHVPTGSKAKTHTVKIVVIQKVESVTLDKREVEVSRGGTVKITSTVLPVNASNPKVKWESSNVKVATVSANGTVRGVSPGTATITATSTDETKIVAKCKVEVYPPVTKVQSAYTNIEVEINTTYQPLPITIFPEDAKYKGVSFTSSDESIVKVDSKGSVTGVGLGKAFVTVTSTEPTVTPKLTYVNVHVVQKVEEVDINLSRTEVATSARVTLTATTGPKDATNPKVIWTSSDPEIASVTDGVVTGHRIGTTTITATSADGSNISDSCRVTVYQLVTRIGTDNTKVGITVGTTQRLQVEVVPLDARDRRLTWTSDNTRIATVDNEGRVTGVRVGPAKITATANDGSGKKLEYNVFIEPEVPLEAISFTCYGSGGYNDEFAVKFQNLTATRTVEYFEFTVIVNEGKRDERVLDAYSYNVKLGPGLPKELGRWDMADITNAQTVDVRLTYVLYADGTEVHFKDKPIIGRFEE